MIAAARPGIRHQVVTRHAVLSDNFNRADSTSVINPASDGNSWTREAGTWGISSNRGYMSSITGGGTARTGGGYISISTDPGFSQVDIKVTNTRANNAGFSAIMFAADTSPSGNALVLRHDAFNSALIAWDGTTSTTLASGFLTAWTGGSTDLRIVYDPTSGAVTILQNGVTKLTYTVALLYRYTGSVVALGSQVSTAGEFWDDFRVSGTLPTIFTDDFNRADSTTSVGNGWSVLTRQSATVTKTWGLASGRAYCSATPTYHGTLDEAGLVRNTTSGDFDMTFSLPAYHAGPFAAPVAMLRADPAQDDGADGLGYFLLNRTNLIELISNTGGGTSWGGFNLAAGDVVRVVASGTSIQVYQNGTRVVNATSTYNQTAKSHGLASFDSAWDQFTFDDFTITYT